MRSLRKDKRDWMNSVAHEAEDAGQQGQLKGVYEAARPWNEAPKNVGMVKSKERLPTKEGEVKARWQEHFMEISNRPVPEVVAEVNETKCDG